MKSIKFLVSCLGLVAAVLSAGENTPGKGSATAITYFDGSDASAKPGANNASYVFVDPADPAVAAIAQLGFRTIDRVGTMLSTEVTRELATKDTAEIVPAMHLKGMELPKSQPGQPKITAIRRTSLMLRDPANAPDGADRAAMDKIHTQLMNDQSPDKMLVQKIEQAGKPTEWRVYRPIATTQSCLACHGDPKTFRPGVREALDKMYPEDKAFDYAKQEWRGVLRVSIVTEAAKK